MSRLYAIILFDYAMLFLKPEIPIFGRDDLANTLYEIRQRYALEIDVGAQTYRNRVSRRFFIAHHQHIRNLLHLSIADLGVHALTTPIDLGPDTCILERFQHSTRILMVTVG